MPRRLSKPLGVRMRTESRGSTAARVAVVLGVGALAAVGTAALTAGALSVYAARTVITPPSRRPDDIPILRVDLAARIIVLGATLDSRLPGEYSLWFAGDTGHAVLGDIIDSDERTVTRRLLRVNFGALERARHGRFSGWVYLAPEELGVRSREVSIATPLGDAPAWHVPAAWDETDRPADNPRWVIQVHGRAVRRAETIRAVPVFADHGYDSLLISYRNDGDAPRSPDHRYALGDREWRDVEAALRFAVAHGAREIVLMGWSMGGATVLQTLTRSAYRTYIRGVVLDSPVVDWLVTLDFQAASRRLPRIVRFGVFTLFRERWGRFFTGLAEPLDFERLDFVARAREIEVPVLLLHSDDDGFVPSDASRALAAARPDVVQLEVFQVARHTKLWNYDRERWERVVGDWLAALRPQSSREPDA